MSGTGLHDATAEPEAPAQTDAEAKSYLTDGYSLTSWLLTTDHKRVAILYLISITGFFFIGACAAALIRLTLLSPDGGLLSDEGYNRAFTLHGVVMIWFFLIPSIPNVFGNFLIPLMIGARDLAFPRLNLASWYIYMFGGLFTVAVLVFGGVDTGWTFYTPLSTTYANGNHNCLGFNFQRSQPVWPMRSGGRIVDRMVAGTLLANNGETVRRMAVAGAGLARIGDYHARSDIEQGRLVEVLADAGVDDEEEIAALYLGAKRMPARIRVFLDFVVPRLREFMSA